MLDCVDILSVVTCYVHRTVVVVPREMGHVSMQCHAVIKSTLIRLSAEVVRLEHAMNFS